MVSSAFLLKLCKRFLDDGHLQGGPFAVSLSLFLGYGVKHGLRVFDGNDLRVVVALLLVGQDDGRSTQSKLDLDFPGDMRTRRHKAKRLEFCKSSRTKIPTSATPSTFNPKP